MNNINMYQEVKTVFLDIVTPVNIGAAYQLTAKDYIYNSYKQEAYFLDDLHWHQFIMSKNLFTEYEQYMTAAENRNTSKKESNPFPEGSLMAHALANKGKKGANRNMLVQSNKKNNINSSNLPLYDWLCQKLNTKSITPDLLGKAMKSVAKAEQSFTKKSLNDIKAHIKLADGRAYIPGSSIKGAIHTAILYHLLQKNPSFKEKLWKEIKSIDFKNNQLKYIHADLERITKKIDKTLLSILEIDDEKSNDSLESVMRGIICSDAMPQKELHLGILQKIDIITQRSEGHRNFAPKENKHSLFRECILPNEQLQCQIKIDKKMTKLIGINSIDDILNLLKNYFLFVNELLLPHFPSQKLLFNQLSTANAYLGGGTGFHSKTLLYALAPNATEGNYIAKAYLKKAFSKKNLHDHDWKISPHTLKTTKLNNKNYIMGAVNIHL